MLPLVVSLVCIGVTNVACAELRLQTVVNPSANIVERISAVHALDKNLGTDDLRVAYAFLRHKPDASEKNPAGLRYLKNEVITALRNQAVPPPSLTQLLTSIAADPAQDTGIRDYALQHLSCWYEEGAADSIEAKDEIRHVLKSVAESETEIAATALLALHRLSALDGSLDREDINSTALRLARSSPKASVKVTALQICSERGCVAALPTARAIAQSSGESTLRVSAIAALGRLGDGSDMIFLHRLQGEASASLAPALAAALKKLEQRNQNAAF